MAIEEPSRLAFHSFLDPARMPAWMSSRLIAMPISTGSLPMVAARKLFPEAKLVLPAGGQETLRNFLAVHDLNITKLKDIDLSQVTRLVLVDTQEPDRIGALKACVENSSVEVVVFDHHVEQDMPCAGRSK